MSGVDVRRPDLATCTDLRIVSGAGPLLCVIETETGGSRRECDPAHSMRWDEGRPLFRCLVDIRRSELPVPM